MFFDAELDYFNDEIHSNTDADRVVEGKGVDGKALPVDDHLRSGCGWL